MKRPKQTTNWYTPGPSTVDDLEAYLWTCPGMVEITFRGTVVIDGTERACVGYRQRLMPPVGSRSTRPYTVEHVYVVGALPTYWHPTGIDDPDTKTTTFKLTGDDRLWYVAGYSDDACGQDAYRAFHPFGHWFNLAPDEHDVLTRNAWHPLHVTRR